MIDLTQSFHRESPTMDLTEYNPSTGHGQKARIAPWDDGVGVDFTIRHLAGLDADDGEEVGVCMSPEQAERIADVLYTAAEIARTNRDDNESEDAKE
jgi:hypothetical protein